MDLGKFSDIPHVQLQLNHLIASRKIDQSSKISDFVLRDYQLDAINWLAGLKALGVSGALLGDEMGLGKTAEIIGFLAYLQDIFESQDEIGNSGVLIIVPLSTLDQWCDEFRKICPSLDVFRFHGDKPMREQLCVELRRKLCPSLSTLTIVLTTYEVALMENSFLCDFTWELLVVDEGHRLKNRASKLYCLLKDDYSWKFAILLTGTPIQNNIRELFALLHFVVSSYFPSEDDFLDFSQDVMCGKPCVNKIQQIIRPFLLRRLKEDVLSLPSVEEIVLFTEMSAMQRLYYQNLLARETSLLSSSKISLMNMLMQLRKCCNHPYLFDGAEPLFNGEFVLGEHLITNSGKLIILDQLLEKLLLGEKRKVLIFSQMVRMLDILQDYLHHRGYNYQRLDGSVRGEERAFAVKSFCDSSDPQIFLLSTRAGGLGLNLAAADTVIFFDSDWNPQCDLQAQARVHRIGQSNSVKVIRLVTKNTVDEIILRKSFEKLHLSEAVIKKGQFSGVNFLDKIAPKEFDLHELLIFGADKICENPNDGSIREKKPILSEDEISSILFRKSSMFVDEEKQACFTKRHKSSSSTERGVSCFDCSDSVCNDMYCFEGVYYSKSAKTTDRNAYNKLVHTVQNKDKTPSKELENRRIKIQREYDERKRLVLKEKWKVNGYHSFSINIPSDSSRRDSLPDVDIENLLIYRVGSVFEPFVADNDKSVIVAIVVDSSGLWSKRGFLFSHIGKISGNFVPIQYADAKHNSDLKIGDFHLIPVQRMQENPSCHFFVGLLVCQNNPRKSAGRIVFPKLEISLKKLAYVAREKNASVHLPRIGAGTPGFNWYSVERMLRLCLASQGINTTVYYYPKK